MTEQAGAATEEPGDRGFWRAVDWLTASHFRAAVFLVLLSLAGFLPGLQSIQPIDRDEARFAQASRQMLETGDFIDIRMHDEPRYKKPVGIYWLQAGLVTLTGQGAEAPIGAYRLASVAGAIAAVLLLYWSGLALFGRRAALVAAALFACSLMVTVEAHLAKTDAVLAATVILTQGALARLYLPTGDGKPPLLTSLLFWIGLGLGILVKGPVILMVSGLTIAALIAVDRRAAWLRRLRPLIGLPVTLAIVLPWFIAILSIAGKDFLSASVGHDLLGKVAASQEGHGAPPGTHLLLLFAMFFPGIALALMAVPHAWRHRRDPAVRFCLAWIVPSWLVFEAVVTKLPHYTLPLYPAIALLTGGAAAAGFGIGRRYLGASLVFGAVLAVILPAAAVGALAWFEGITAVPAIVVAVAVTAIAIVAVLTGTRGAPMTAAVLLSVAAIAGYATAFGYAMPRLDTFRLSPRLAEAAKRVAGCETPAVFSAGYEEPSLIFAVGTDIRFGNGAGAADFLKEGGCRVALVAPKQEARFLRRAAQTGIEADLVETVKGINLGHYGELQIGVYRAGAAPPTEGAAPAGGAAPVGQQN